MLNIFDSLFLFLPEIVMVLGAMIVLMIGAFNFSRIAVTSALIITFLASLLVMLTGPQSFKAFNEIINLNPYIEFSSLYNVKAFNGLMDSNMFIKFGKFLITIASTIVLILTISEKRPYELSALIMLSTSGMMFLISSSNLLSFYISLELMSLPLYIMAAFDREDSKSSEAGLKYFILGSIASGLFLMGATFVYGFTGSISFDGIYDYYVNFSNDSESVAVPIGFLVGLMFIIVALLFKISAVPFHMWTPDVYQGAPTIVTTFLASTAKAAALVAFTKLLLDPFAELYVQWQQVLVVISIASMFVGSIGAIMQTNFKRFLAYSSIGHVGFMLAGILTTENEGIQGFLIYLTIYLTMIIATLTCLLLLRKDDKPIENIYDIAGISKTAPQVALALTILMLSMAGIPPLAGFFAKFYILIPLIKVGLYNVAVAFIIASVIATFYYLKIIKIMYFDEPRSMKVDLSVSKVRQLVLAGGTLFNLLYVFMPTGLIITAKVASMILFK